MRTWIEAILGSRFWALVRKEVAQTLHNRQLVIQLLLPPTLFLVLFGFALNPEFENLAVGITDYSNSRASRDFIEVLGQTNAFTVSEYYTNEQNLTEALARGNLSVALIIPPTFDDDLARRRSPQVQAIFDAVDANTASIASGYLTQLIADYNLRLTRAALQRQASLPSASSTNNQQALTTTGASSSSSAPPTASSTATVPRQASRSVEVNVSVLYNPGLRVSWFIVSGMIGILLTVLGSQAASSLVVREKEAGTVEQLLMTPASNTEIILSKILPLLVLLTIDACIALTIGRIVFNLPIRGNLLLFLSIAALYFWVGISIGILIATYAKSEQQAQLTAFFVNPPLTVLSGATTPIAAMPAFMQAFSYLNPLRYFIEVCRGVLLKGVGLEMVWSQVLILFVFAIVLVTLSVRRFRRQLM